MPILVRAAMMSASEAVLRGSALERTVPERMKGSCGMAMRRSRRSSRGMVLMSIPSMRIEPEEISTRRSRVSMRELFPLLIYQLP